MGIKQVVQQVEQQQQIEQEVRQTESTDASKTSVVTRKASSSARSIQINGSAKKSDTSSSSSIAEERKLSNDEPSRQEGDAHGGLPRVHRESRSADKPEWGPASERGESEDQLRGPGQTGGDGILSAV